MDLEQDDTDSEQVDYGPVVRCLLILVLETKHDLWGCIPGRAQKGGKFSTAIFCNRGGKPEVCDLQVEL